VSSGGLSAAEQLALELDPDTLAHLAWIARSRDPQLQARRRLDDASLDELATLLLRHESPTYGWWTRHTGRHREIEALIVLGRAFGSSVLVAGVKRPDCLVSETIRSAA
jgi:hypothetical protein